MANWGFSWTKGRKIQARVYGWVCKGTWNQLKSCCITLTVRVVMKYSNKSICFQLKKLYIGYLVMYFTAWQVWPEVGIYTHSEFPTHWSST